MTAILLKLPEELLLKSGKSATVLNLSRAEYIRRAIDRMNRLVEAHRKSKRLAEVSLRIRAESLRINAEFDALESTPEI